MNFNFKKIASIASSTLLIGSTVALAAAANYPAPFVSGSNADVAIVVGANAAPTDTTAAQADIYSHLATVFAANGGTTTTTTTTTNSSVGDVVKLSKSSDKINLRDNVATVFGSTVDDDDLPTLLKDGTYENDENTEFDYEQRITLGNGLILNYFSDSDYSNEALTTGINLTSNQVVLNYTLDFTTAAESDVSGGDLIDIETTTIQMLGRDYYVLDADNATGDLTLLDSAASAVLNEGEVSTITAGGTTYSVGISYISTSEVVLTVNGQTTNSLSEGETEKLADGTYIGIKDIRARDVQGAIGQVEISLGSGKIELQNGTTIELNDDDVEEVTATIFKAAPSSGKERIDSIRLSWTTDDEAFITPDQNLVIPGFENIAFSMDDFMTPSEEVTTVTPSGSDVLELKTTLKDGEVTMPILYANSSGEYSGVGESATKLLRTSAVSQAGGTANSFVFNDTAGFDWLVASWNTSSEAESYLLKFSLSTKDGDDKVTISKVTGTGTVQVCGDKSTGDTCDIGSLTLNLYNVSKVGSDEAVNLSGNAGSSFRHLYTESGLKITLPVSVGATGDTQNVLGNINFSNASAGYGYDSIFLGFVEENKDDDIAAGNVFNITIDDQSDGDVEVSTITTGKTALTDPDDNNHQFSRVYSDVATLVERIGDSSSQREAKITYSGGEAYANVYLSAPGVVGGSSSGGTLGGITVTDDQVSTVSGKNMIVVGGSCVNTVAAKLLGSSTPVCGADFTAMSGGVGSGQFLIQAFNSPYSSGKVALLVAGYDAQDTINSAKYLTTQTVDTAVGKKYVGTSATQATLVATGA